MSNTRQNHYPAMSPLPCREGEITINARLLHPYVVNPELSYEKWAMPLQNMAAESRGISAHWLRAGPDGELALTYEAAHHFASRYASDLMGAIALVLMAEGLHGAGAGAGDPGFINRMLGRFEVLTVLQGQMHAETLHSFLEVEETYEQWFCRLKKDHAMKYGKDYVRITFEGTAKPKQHKKDAGEGEVILGPWFAMKISAAEPTLRGKLLRICFGPSYMD